MLAIMVELGEFLILALAAGAVWVALSAKPVFKIRVAAGCLRVTNGKVTADLQEQAAEIFDQWKIRQGWIAGVGRGRGLRLTFSPSVPPGCRQQLRNLWTNR
jgi:hypothetical protein